MATCWKFGGVLAVFLVAAVALGAPAPSREERPPSRQAQEAREALGVLERRAKEDGSKSEGVWQLWQQFRLRHGGTPEYLRAAQVMSRVRSPLDALDRNRVPPEDRQPWLPPEVVAVLGGNRMRHWNDVLEVAVSPDGKLVASLGRAEAVRVWEAETMRERAVLEPHGLKPGASPFPWSVAFRPKSRQLVIGQDGAASVWDLSGDKPKLTRLLEGVDRRVASLAFTRDGNTLAVQGHTHTVLWDLRGDSPRRLRTIPTGPASRFVALSPGGQLLADTGGGPERVRLWRLAAGEDGKPALLNGALGPLVFSPDGKRLVSTMSRPPVLRVWEVSGKAPQALEDLHVGLGVLTTALAFSPDGSLLASTDADQRLYLWPLDDHRRKDLRLAPGQTHRRYTLGARANSLAFFPNGKAIVLGCTDGTVRTWDIGRAAERFDLRNLDLNVIAFGPDGRSLATGGRDHLVRLWEVAGGRFKERAVLRGHRNWVTDLAFHPRGRYLASLGVRADEKPNAIRLWDTNGPHPREEAALRPHSQVTRSIDFSSDGTRFLATGADQVDQPDQKEPVETEEPQLRAVPGLSLWDFRAGRLQRSGTIHLAFKPKDVDFQGILFADAAAFAPGGKALLFDLGDTHWLCAVATPGDRPLAAFKHHRGILSVTAFSPDARMLAEGDWVDGEKPKAPGQGLVRFWELGPRGAKERRRLELGPARLRRLAFTPDGKRLLLADEPMAHNYSRVSVWEVASGKKVKEWSMPGLVRDLRMAPDGRHFATANGNGTVYIFRLD